MLQGAVVALILSGIAGVLAYAGVGGAGSHDAAYTFLLVGLLLIVASRGMTRLRR